MSLNRGGKKLVHYHEIKIGLSLEFFFEALNFGIGKNSIRMNYNSWMKVTHILTYVLGFRSMPNF